MPLDLGTDSVPRREDPFGEQGKLERQLDPFAFYKLDLDDEPARELILESLQGWFAMLSRSASWWEMA